MPEDLRPRSLVEPFLVIARHIPIASLRAEDGGPADAMIRKIAEFWWLLQQPGATVNLNFRLVEPIPAEHLVVQKLDRLAEQNPYE